MICEGLPKEFGDYMDYVKALKFEERPDYVYLRKIFRRLFIRSEFKFDYKWE